MVNKSKWIYNFNSLTPDNQLIVADAIAEELKTNQCALDADEYDLEKSELVRDFFCSLKQNITSKEEFKEFKDIISKYETLSLDSKSEANDEIIAVIKKYLDIENQQEKEKICEQKGHAFGKWQTLEYCTYEDVLIDHQLIKDCKVPHISWERTCSRCGFVEETEIEPQELIDEIETKRQKRNKQARIRRLEKTLKDLKNEEDK